MLSRRLRAIPIALATALIGIAGHATGAGFPEREVRIITGFPAGSAAESSLRALVQTATKHLGQPLVIINRPGGSQSIAMTELANATPDGYTIGMTTDGFKALTVKQQRVRFNPDDLKMVLGYAQFRHVLFVRSASPYKRYEDFISAAKANPKSLDYSGTGQGTAPDLLGKVFARDAGIALNYVPYKGSNEQVPAVMGGHVQSGIIDISGIRAHVEGGALSLVLVFGDKRLPEFPDVPTSQEKGLRDLNLFNSVLAITLHRDTPADRVAILHEAFRKTVQDPEFLKAAAATGLGAVYVPGERVEQGIENIRRVGVPLLKELNLLVE